MKKSLIYKLVTLNIFLLVLASCEHNTPVTPVDPVDTTTVQPVDTGSVTPIDTTDVEPLPDHYDSLLMQMTLRERVGQLFCIRPEALDTTINIHGNLRTNPLQSVNERMLAFNERYPVGGVILYAHNISNETQLTRFTEQLHALNGQPLLYIDEEGGTIARIGNNSNFNVERFPPMASIGATGDPSNAYHCGNAIGTYLHQYGLDVNLAPVADVNTNPDNIVIGNRAFSNDPQVAAPMVVQYLLGLHEAGTIGCLKHFPGHGDTKTDTHYGYAETLKTWPEMLACEMITFRAGIDAGAQMIMTAHIAAPNVTNSAIPATMSSLILQNKLRGELGYEHIIITDGMEMGAITQQYTPGNAAVGCLQAGADIILGPEDFIKAFEAVVHAVEVGSIPEWRINQSVRRILMLKENRP